MTFRLEANPNPEAQYCECLTVLCELRESKPESPKRWHRSPAPGLPNVSDGRKPTCESLPYSTASPLRKSRWSTLKGTPILPQWSGLGLIGFRGLSGFRGIGSRVVVLQQPPPINRALPLCKDYSRHPKGVLFNHGSAFSLAPNFKNSSRVAKTNAIWQ